MALHPLVPVVQINTVIVSRGSFDCVLGNKTTSSPFHSICVIFLTNKFNVTLEKRIFFSFLIHIQISLNKKVCYVIVIKYKDYGMGWTGAVCTDYSSRSLKISETFIQTLADQISTFCQMSSTFFHLINHEYKTQIFMYQSLPIMGKVIQDLQV